jgi:hypothetical protein
MKEPQTTACGVTGMGIHIILSPATNTPVMQGSGFPEFRRYFLLNQAQLSQKINLSYNLASGPFPVWG